MAWYGWLLIGVLGAAAIFLLIAFLTKKPIGLTPEERKKLVDAETKDLQDRLAAEQEERRKLAELVKKHTETYAKLRDEFEKSLEEIADDRREKAKELLADSAGLLAELDKLVE